MKLLPHVFKWIGLFVFFIGFIISAIDDGRKGFMEGYNEASNNPIEVDFEPILPEMVSQIADFSIFLGLLIYVLSKSKREDEFFQKMRNESAYIVLVVSIAFFLILYLFNPEMEISPTIIFGPQMILYLIIRAFRRNYILEGE